VWVYGSVRLSVSQNSFIYLKLLHSGLFLAVTPLQNIPISLLLCYISEVERLSSRSKMRN